MARTTRKKERKEKRRASARERAERRGSGSTSHLNLPKDMSVFELDKEGAKRVRILEYEAGVGNKYAKPGEYTYERTYWAHRIFSAADGKELIVCPRKTITKDNPKSSKCPICEYIAEENQKADADEEEISSFFAKERQLFNVYDIKDDDKGVQVFDISYHLFGKVIDNKMKNDDEDEYGNFASTEDDGKLIKLEVVEKSFGGGKFFEVAGIEFKDADAVDPEVAEGVACLDDCLVILSPKEITDKFMQAVSGNDDGDDDDEETPKKRSSKKRQAKKEEPEEDGEEDNEEGEGDDSEGESESAEDKGITVGCDVEIEELGTCEVLYISNDGERLRVKDEDGKTHKNVSVSDVEEVLEPEDEPEPEDDEEDEKDKDDDEWDWDEDDDEGEEEEAPKKERSKPRGRAADKQKEKAKRGTTRRTRSRR